MDYASLPHEEKIRILDADAIPGNPWLSAADSRRGLYVLSFECGFHI